MKPIRKPNGYWNKQRCTESAAECSSRKEFEMKWPTAYMVSLKNKWMDEICNHMKRLGSKHYKCTYAYEFSDNHVYIGITFNLGLRNLGHLNKNDSAVYKHIMLSGLQPILIQLTEYVSNDEAISNEFHYIEQYKLNGWIILNIAKPGGIGSSAMKWSKERCIEEALKYKTRSEFRYDSSVCYAICCKNDWIDEVCTHMIRMISPRWTKDMCINEALNYTNRSKYCDNSNSSYNAARRNGWLDEVCFHMKPLIHPNSYWTKERCSTEAAKYTKRSQFEDGCGSAYMASLTNKWLDEFFSN